VPISHSASSAFIMLRVSCHVCSLNLLNATSISAFSHVSEADCLLLPVCRRRHSRDTGTRPPQPLMVVLNRQESRTLLWPQCPIPCTKGNHRLQGLRDELLRSFIAHVSLLSMVRYAACQTLLSATFTSLSRLLLSTIFTSVSAACGRPGPLLHQRCNPDQRVYLSNRALATRTTPD
jgi:hypothetical protein